ncbi:cyclase family protein [Paenibacillus thiaminolyticus]|uniref:Cyclase family protein n=1 Tax=Paenibacillus thiaminolyticus TaxID=49283 RepID=A0AAP9DSC8_PANTH|nr:cyclase family protein [Paenibacillus thiaminolyticus]MCY9538499.1 cyclase family protein [Paenibacillus thiaminolyticus]MCY9601236.1 cyclase family protein [Paenibacillus thiaminolyticus]MCY9605836.1 cyclase family protein [Paenibacillus thiaminolyticus]MCY9611285.1 cyclase family protein [Paenibacillus thiaminolyticus]MCY9617514.1 cyclase family protein [Paenibacillus thiaminolyticus]
MANSNELINALQRLKEKEWVDLTHTFGPESPHFFAFADAQFTTLFNHDDGFFAQSFTFAGQYGTHLDAPIHFVRNRRYLDELDLKELVLPLVVIDKSKEAEANHDYALSVEDILQFEAEHGTIEAGSFVALRTDWSKRWPEKDAFNNKDADGHNHAPGWSLAALQFLFQERNIKAIGHETFDTDASIDYQKNGALLAEYYVLEQDAYQVELMKNLDKVPATGAIIFNIVPKPEKASGFPVRSFAILP